ncbi:hypothetical protein ACLSU7_04825 [Bdellovibrio sp. HCB185ZH]|uniref:hypothetical protein n=1 Tax=Bdellovibrio sp. HCB185ZH TaxID=3394235 RepID=UPI0039A44672
MNQDFFRSMVVARRDWGSGRRGPQSLTKAKNKNQNAKNKKTDRQIGFNTYFGGAEVNQEFFEIRRSESEA